MPYHEYVLDIAYNRLLKLVQLLDPIPDFTFRYFQCQLSDQYINNKLIFQRGITASKFKYLFVTITVIIILAQQL